MASAEEKNSLDAIIQLAEELGFENIDVQMEKMGKAGFLGDVFKAKVTGKRNGIQENLAVVAKTLPQTKFHEEMEIEKFYNMEAFVYSKIFLVFDKLQEELKVTNGFRHPVVLKTILEPKKETVLMEDLTEKGFQNCKLAARLDLDHAILILEELGKLHALSFALKQQNLQQFEKLTCNIEEGLLKIDKDDKLTKLTQMGYKNALKVLVSKEAKEKIVQLELEAYEYHPNLLAEQRNGPNAVLTHGDMWTNNVVYKYKDDKIEEVLILDWQTPRIASPIMDVIFFMLTSLDDQVRSDNFELLLRKYYDFLASSIRQLHCDPNQVYSHDAYRQDLKKMARAALTHVIIMLPIFANKPEDVNLEPINEEMKPIKYSDTYISKVRGGIDDLIANKLI